MTIYAKFLSVAPTEVSAVYWNNEVVHFYALLDTGDASDVAIVTQGMTSGRIHESCDCWASLCPNANSVLEEAGSSWLKCGDREIKEGGAKKDGKIDRFLRKMNKNEIIWLDSL